MKKSVVVGTFVFAVVATVLGVAFAATVDILKAPDVLASIASTFIVFPVAIVVAKRAGRVGHLSLLVASLLLMAAIYSVAVFAHDWVARPAGGRVTFVNLVDTLGVWSMLLETITFVAVPQLWLLLLNRLAANNSSKPTPLRGAA